MIAEDVLMNVRCERRPAWLAPTRKKKKRWWSRGSETTTVSGTSENG